MTQGDFDDDSTIQEIIDRITQDNDLADFVEGMEAALQLPQEAREYVAIKADEEFVSDKIVGLDKDEKRELRAKAMAISLMRKGGFLADASGEVGGITVKGAMLGQRVSFVVENRGSDASPFARAFAEAAAKLSDEEYSLPENLLMLMGNAVDVAQGIEPPESTAWFGQNPFRPKRKAAPIPAESPETEARLKSLKETAPAKPVFKKAP